MSRFRISVIALILAWAIGAVFPARGEGTWYLRVIARNDGAQAQAEKMRVRSAVLAACAGEKGPSPAAFARMEAAAAALAPCRVEKLFWSPGGDAPPRPTVYITLGEGAGHNWWGVLWQDSLKIAQAEEGEETGQVEFLWPLWDWLLSLLGMG